MLWSDPVPSYSETGTDNLEAQANVYASGDLKSTPPAKGMNAGGTGGDYSVKSNMGKGMPGSGANTPKGVQSFDGEAV